MKRARISKNPQIGISKKVFRKIGSTRMKDGKIPIVESPSYKISQKVSVVSSELFFVLKKFTLSMLKLIITLKVKS